MNNYEENAYKVFGIFHNQWAAVTAGSPEHFNSCTVGWGSMGTLWSKPVITVYLHPSRYTNDFMKDSGEFTVSFFPAEYKKALGILGSRSGRDCDKTKASGLTPVKMGESITYKEAELTFLCRKLYQHKMSKEDLAPDIQELYRSKPQAFPVDENGEWQPHWTFVGEVIAVEDKRRP
ncbi:flavin reductase [bacterium]|nr:flavin reductase [bacterium]